MLKKNQGHVLIIVLLIFTISFILITALFSLSVNTRKQINISDIEMQKTNAAEMGINLFEKYLLKVIQSKNYKNVNELLQQLKDQLNPLIKSRTIDNNLSYNINKIDISSTLDSQKNTIITLVVSTQGIFKDSVKTLNKTYTLTVPNGSDGSSGGIFTSQSQFDAISPSNKNFPALSPVLSGKGNIPNKCTDISNCNLNTDVDFIKSLTLTGNYTVNGNTKFEDYTVINDNSKITINKDAQFNNTILFNKPSELFIGGNTLFNDYVDLEKNGYAKLSIGGDARFNNAIKPKNSQITINGNTLFNNSLELTISNVSLHKNAYFSNSVFLTSSKMMIDGSALFDNYLSVSNDSSVTIMGNFYTNHYIAVNGTVCVNGSSNIGNGPSNTNAQIIRNASSCGYTPGTIYILNKPIQSGNNTGDLNIK